MATYPRFHRVKTSKPVFPKLHSSVSGENGGSANTSTLLHNISALRAYRSAKRKYNADVFRTTVHNVNVVYKYVFAVCVIALAVGFIFVMWNRDFSFHSLMEDITSTAVAPFDFVGLMENLNIWVNALPSWLGWAGTGIRGIAMIFLSLGYSIGFILQLVAIVFTF